MEKTDKQLIEEFYSKPYYMSYSGMNKLLYSPGLFYNHYILKQEEDKLESYLLEGKVIHCLLLEDDSFNEKFILIPSSIPTTNTKVVLEKVFEVYSKEKAEWEDQDKMPRDQFTNLLSYAKEILEILQEMNLHQALKDTDKPDKDGNTKGDEKRIAKICTSDALSYWEFMKIRDGKDLVDADLMESAREAVDAFKEHKEVMDLLGYYVTEMDNAEVFNERYLTVETDKAFGLKGFVDNIKVDHDKKTIYINDVKKTSKSLNDFVDAIEIYNYWVQAAIYYRLVHAKFNDLMENGYTIEFRFIVIDRYLQIYPFPVSGETMMSWQSGLEVKLNEASWHYDKRNYSLPYQFATGKVIL